MKQHVLILGASYGSLLGTKLLMAGHRVTREDLWQPTTVAPGSWGHIKHLLLLRAP